jgi:hypothetical protein
MTRHRDWTPQQHIDEACRLLDKTAEMANERSTGNAPIGMIEALAHAALAEAKATVSVIGAVRAYDR